MNDKLDAIQSCRDIHQSFGQIAHCCDAKRLAIKTQLDPECVEALRIGENRQRGSRAEVKIGPAGITKRLLLIIDQTLDTAKIDLVVIVTRRNDQAATRSDALQ